MQSEMTLTLLVLLINFQLFASMHQRIHSVTFLLILFGEWEEGW